MLWVVDNLLLDHAGLPYVLDLVVHLVNLVGCLVKGGHSMTFLLLALLYFIIKTAPSPRVWGLGMGLVN